MMVVLKYSEDKELIFSNVAKLKGKKNARKKLFFVNNDLPEEEKELRHYFRDLKREAEEESTEENKIKVSLRKGKLFVNNERISPRIHTPLAAEVLTLSPEELQELKQVKIYEVVTHEEKSSEFLCYYQRVTTVDEAQQGVAKLKIKHGDATHIVSAYCLESPKGPFKQGYSDDKEAGAGRNILQKMKEKKVQKMAIYIIRYYGGIHLGKGGLKFIQTYHLKSSKSTRSKWIGSPVPRGGREVLHNFRSYLKLQKIHYRILMLPSTQKIMTQK